MSSSSLLGVKIDRVTLQEILSVIDKSIADKECNYFVSMSALTILEARKYPAFNNIVDASAISICDGFGAKAGFELINGGKIEKISGVDLFPAVCGHAEGKNYSVFLIGASDAVIKTAAEKIKQRFPALKICGYLGGFFDTITEKEALSIIKKARPDLLFVGMGQPKQEEWIFKNLKELSVPVSMGIGGSFDVISGKLKRAPLFFRNAGLEWFYRLIKEPKRLKKDAALLYFFWIIIVNLIPRRKSK